MSKVKVWDPLVRTFHWALVGFFAANAVFVDDDGKEHIWIGYTVAVLITIRIIWGFVGTKYARFGSFPPSASAASGQLTDIATGRKREHIGHTPLGAWMIYNLLLAIIVISASGYLMTTDMFWGVEWPEEVHELAVAWAEVSIIMHVLAVIFESVRLRTNLPRAMVTGYKIMNSDR